MKKHLLLLVVSIFLASCSSVKQAEKALNTGNYEQTIHIALNKLKTNKQQKNKQAYILMLENAYAKAVERDKSTLSFLKKEGNPDNIQRIYHLYVSLKNRQEKIKPLLPLYLIEQKRPALFDFNNYDNDIILTKNKLSNHLYTNANTLLSQATTKEDYRAVYNQLMTLNNISPNYKKTHQLMKVSHLKGTRFIKVHVKNKTNMVIPKSLQTDLLNFDTYGLNDQWTVYHNRPQNSIKYDYVMDITFREIKTSPEQLRERQLKKEKLIKDGWKYLRNNSGQFILDNKGKKIKVDNMIKVYCHYYEFIQLKSVNINGHVQYRNLNTQQLLKAFPISSEFTFKHIYANYKGDKRALENNLLPYLTLKSVKFPTNQQMIYDSGTHLKNEIKKIIAQHSFE